MAETTLAQATHELYERITRPSFPKWLVSIGQADQPDNPRIVVYTTHLDMAKHAIPSEWMGYPVVFRQTERPTIGGPT